MEWINEAEWKKIVCARVGSWRANGGLKGAGLWLELSWGCTGRFTYTLAPPPSLLLLSPLSFLVRRSFSLSFSQHFVFIYFYFFMLKLLRALGIGPKPVRIFSFFFNYYYFSCRFLLVFSWTESLVPADANWIISYIPHVAIFDLVEPFGNFLSLSISLRVCFSNFGFNSTVKIWCGESGFRYRSCPEQYRSWHKRGLWSFNHLEKTPGCYRWDGRSVTANTIAPNRMTS